MPQYDLAGRPRLNTYKAVAASQTTANISTPSDSVPGRDYLERVIITAATSLVGNVSVFDGGTTLFTYTGNIAGRTDNLVTVIDVQATAKTTAGFNVTTGSSVSCICIGSFS